MDHSRAPRAPLVAYNRSTARELPWRRLLALLFALLALIFLAQLLWSLTGAPFQISTNDAASTPPSRHEFAVKVLYSSYVQAALDNDTLVFYLANPGPDELVVDSDHSEWRLSVGGGRSPMSYEWMRRPRSARSLVK